MDNYTTALWWIGCKDLFSFPRYSISKNFLNIYNFVWIPAFPNPVTFTLKCYAYIADTMYHCISFSAVGLHNRHHLQIPPSSYCLHCKHTIPIEQWTMAVLSLYHLVLDASSHQHQTLSWLWWNDVKFPTVNCWEQVINMKNTSVMHS